MNLKISLRLLPLLGAAAWLTGCATRVGTPVSAVPTTDATQVGEIRAGSGILRGYLDRAALPNSLTLLPPPPAKGSSQAAADEAVFRQTRSFEGTARWTLAVQDANLHFPEAAGTYACALGVDIDATRTPHLNMLLRRTLADAGLSTYRAKDHYNRTRPFVELKAGSCTPAEEARLAKDGSYPSGHSALGWAWALMLAELAPERADAVLARGYAFSQSRVICGVHWQSDVEQGRVMGAATVARLHADATFLAQMQAAKAELAALRSAGATTTRDCAAEASALNLK